MGMGISSGYSGMEGKPNTQSKIEAKYPALLFKQHLTACVEKLYGMIRDSLKKEISPFLNSCIQVKTNKYITDIYELHLEFSAIKYTNRHQDQHGLDQHEGYREIFFQILWQNNKHQ